MEKHYSIKASNMDGTPWAYCADDLSKEQAKKAYSILSGAFRSVDVINLLTGEVEISGYMSDNFWVRKLSPGEAITQVEVLLK